MWLHSFLSRLYFIYFIYLILFSWLAVVGTLDIGEEITGGVDESVSEQEEESSCSRLLAAAAERVWDIFVQNKREVSFKKVIICSHNTHSGHFCKVVNFFVVNFQAMEDAFKIALPKPSFTSYSSRDYVEHM